jgi:hypothetical protein
MNQEDVMAVLHDIGLTEGEAWTRSELLAHLHNAVRVQVDEIREPTEPGEPLTIRLRSGAAGAPFTLTFEPLGDERYSLSSGSTAQPSA